MRKMTKFWRLYLKFRYLFIPEGPHGDLLRGKLYKPFLKNCGVCFKVYSQAFIYNPNGLSVGDYVCIGFNAYIGAGGDVVLDDGATLGPFVVVSPSTRLRKDGSFRAGGIQEDSVYIGKGTQVAAHACVLAGSSVGKGCLIAAGSIVRGAFKDNVLIAGVPAAIKKDYTE